MPLSGGLLSAYVLCKASCWAKAVEAGEFCSMCFELHSKNMSEQESGISSLSLVC